MLTATNQSAINDKKVRTQVVLTEALKRQIEAKRKATGESISAYLRKAALMRLALERKEKKDLSELADLVIGSVSLEDHPEWKGKKNLQNWIKNLRDEWE